MSLQNEPVMIWPTVGFFVGALLRQFVPDLGDDLIQATVDLIVVLGPVLIGAWYARRRVYGPVTIANLRASGQLDEAEDNG